MDFLANLATKLGFKKSELQKLKEEKLQHENAIRSLSDDLGKLQADIQTKESLALKLRARVESGNGGSKQIDLARLKNLIQDLKRCNGKLAMLSEKINSENSLVNTLEYKITELENPSASADEIAEMADDMRELNDVRREMVKETEKLDAVSSPTPESTFGVREDIANQTASAGGLSAEDEAYLNSLGVPEPAPVPEQAPQQKEEA